MTAPITYLYRCFDREGQLLYVGITDDVERRKREHAKDKYWWRDVARITKMAFPRRIEALWAEWAVITTCSPVYNQAASPPPLPQGNSDLLCSFGADSPQRTSANEADMVDAIRPFVVEFRHRTGKVPGQQSARAELRRRGYRVGTRRAGEIAVLAAHGRRANSSKSDSGSAERSA